MNLKVKDKKIVTKNVFSLIFEKPKDFNFYAGQYLDYQLPIKDPLGDTRPFTISASPTEPFLMLSTKKGFSVFKKALYKLKAGDQIQTSHPAGTFILDESSSAVFIAGGIGITPFRSIIKYSLDQKISTPMTLIYSNSDDNFLFKKELESWKQNLPNLTIIYYNSTKNGRLIQLPATSYQLPIYYLAGSHSFVNNMAQILIESGVDETSIRYDRFDGYA